MTRLAQSRYFPNILGLGTIAFVLLLMEFLIRIGVINGFVIPKPSEVMAAVPDLFAKQQAAARLLETGFGTAVAGFLVAIFGVGGGVMLYKFRTLRLATETWVAAAAAAPTALMYPLFLVIFGRNGFTIIVMAFIAGLTPVILKTLEGLTGTRASLLNVGRSFRLTPWQLFWKVSFPSALPTIFVGIRLGLIFAMVNIVGMEFVINFGGLGQLINELAEQYDLAGTYAAIVFVIVISVSVFVVTERLELWLRPQR